MAKINPNIKSVSLSILLFFVIPFLLSIFILFFIEPGISLIPVLRVSFFLAMGFGYLCLGTYIVLKPQDFLIKVVAVYLKTNKIGRLFTGPEWLPTKKRKNIVQMTFGLAFLILGLIISAISIFVIRYYLLGV